MAIPTKFTGRCLKKKEELRLPVKNLRKFKKLAT
jgi:hypothetical protein